jgi:hypothetical protein
VRFSVLRVVGSRPLAASHTLVAYYLSGAEVWKYADSLEAITTNKLTLAISLTDETVQAKPSAWCRWWRLRERSHMQN